MTRTVNARLAGVSFLLYIVTGITSMAVSGRVAGGEGVAAKLAAIAAHPVIARTNVLAALLSAAFALVLGVTLYSLTRDQDPDLAIMGLCCRAGEGLVSAISAIRSLALFSIAAAGPDADSASQQSMAALLLRMGGWSTLISATCFAVGSTLFCYLFLRARSIPVWLAWLGVLSSALLMLCLPLQLIGILKGTVVTMTWFPILVFELIFAFWLIVKGVAVPRAKSVQAGR